MNSKWIILAACAVVGFALCSILDLKHASSYNLKITTQGIEIEAKNRTINALATNLQKMNTPRDANAIRR